MGRLWLIRHGHPDYPLGAHVCLGRTDTPLGPLGRMQACLLGEALREEKPRVFSSPLTRCRETAAPLGGEAAVVSALAEQDMGPWDGLDFEEIKRRWPIRNQRDSHIGRQSVRLIKMAELELVI